MQKKKRRRFKKRMSSEKKAEIVLELIGLASAFFEMMRQDEEKEVEVLLQKKIHELMDEGAFKAPEKIQEVIEVKKPVSRFSDFLLEV